MKDWKSANTLDDWVTINVDWPLAKVPQEELPRMVLYYTLLQRDLKECHLKHPNISQTALTVMKQ